LVLEQTYIDNIKASLPELPDVKKHRFMKDYGLSLQDATVLIGERERAAFFEKAANGNDPKMAANWLLTELLGALNKAEKDLSESPVSAEQLGALVGLIVDDTISGKIAKEVFAEMFQTGKDPAA